MEQKMLRVEGTTKTMAALAGRWLDDEKAMDSLLRRCLEVDDDIQGVSMIFEKGTSPQPSPEKEGYYERYAYYDNEGRILLGTYINGEELESDPDWVLGYLEGKSAWSKVDTIYQSDESEACFAYVFNETVHRTRPFFSEVGYRHVFTDVYSKIISTVAGFGITDNFYPAALF